MTGRDPDTEPQRPDASARDPDTIVTRSEEELRITTHRRPVRRARLITYLETETVTRTIPVRREQVRVEYAPIHDPDDRHPPSAQSQGDERWLVLYEEEVVVQTRWVARERVRLATHSVIENRRITEALRRERVDTDGENRAG